MPYTSTCLNCDETITRKVPRKFCSLSCRDEYRAPRVHKTCVICDKPFTCPPNKADRQVTCLSDECKKAIKFGEHNPFYGRKHTDASKAKVSQTKKGEYTTVVCTCGCGETLELPAFRIRMNKTGLFFVNPTHLHEWLRGENHWNYRGGDIYYGSEWEATAQAVRDRDKVCRECGKTPEENKRSLDVHHVIPVRVSRDNSMDNLIALCQSCHQKHQAKEQRAYPDKVNKYRKCLTCEKVFIPEPFQRFCSEECRRKRTRQWEKKYLDTHPERYQKRRENIKRWQEDNIERVRQSKRKSKAKARNKKQEHV